MSNASNLKPLNNHALVELGGQYQNIQVKEGKYDTQDNGIVIEICLVYRGNNRASDEEIDMWMNLQGKRIFWKPMREGTRVERDGKTYAFIELADIQGVEDVEAE